MSNPFVSLTDFQITYGCILPGARLWPWRLVPDAPCGEINGIPSIRGQAVATNGIIVVVMTSQGKFQFGHYEHFVVDEAEPDGETHLSRIEAKRESKRKSALAEVLTILEE